MEKNQFSSKIDEKRKEFDHLLAKFKSMDDPIERYIKRQEMMEIQQFLEKLGVHIDVP